MLSGMEKFKNEDIMHEKGFILNSVSVVSLGRSAGGRNVVF